MAEYIDKNKIPWAKVDNPKGVFWERVVFESAINNITPADVIERAEYEKVLEENKQLKHIISDKVDKDLKCAFEVKELRSKIDKAIDEIKNITPRATIRHGKTNTDSTLMIPLDKVIEILKRNIGE